MSITSAPAICARLPGTDIAGAARRAIAPVSRRLPARVDARGLAASEAEAQVSCAGLSSHAHDRALAIADTP